MSREVWWMGPVRFSDRVERLRVAYIERSAAAAQRHAGTRLFYDDAELAEFADARVAAYRETVGQPVTLRRARMLELFAERALIACEPDDLLAGSQKFCSFGFPPEAGKALGELGYAHNPGHIIHDYAALLEHGIGGLLAGIAARRAVTVAPAESATLDAFARAMRAFSRFIARHADAAGALAGSTEWRAWAAALARLAGGARPATFREALQMVWFTQVFLHAENPASAISFGRTDQCLWPFLQRDLAAQRLTPQGAADLVAAFFLRCCEGEESQNLTLGGVDAAGRDATNPLSVLMLQVMHELRVIQPSLSVRCHAGTPPEFLAAACALAATGTGQPGFINDDAAIAGLEAAGIAPGRARDYGIVGCYEAAPQGDCYPNTVGNCCAGNVPTLPKLLVEYLDTATARAATAFRPFLDGWFGFVESQYRAALAGPYQQAWNRWRDQAPSPFGSVLLDGCVEHALPLEAGGARSTLFGVNMLGLGTAVDSLHVLEECVFRRQELTLADLAAALAADFPDEALRRQLLALPARFGTDSEATNRLAAEVSSRLAQMVLNSRMDGGVRPYPAFFRFTADVWDHPYATPDGRRRAENLSYGCGPASGCGGTPTAILASAANLAHGLCACGNPLALTLSAADVAGEAGLARLQALIVGYFQRGGFHLHVNLQSAETLRAAKADPANHADVLIRISGLSARFVSLSEPLQDALIERAEKGV